MQKHLIHANLSEQVSVTTACSLLRLSRLLFSQERGLSALLSTTNCPPSGQGEVPPAPVVPLPTLYLLGEHREQFCTRTLQVSPFTSSQSFLNVSS